MEPQKLETPVRIRLVFADRHLLTKEQRSQGFSRSWVAIRAELATVGDFARDLSGRFGLRCSSGHDLVFSMKGFTIPSFESSSIFRENDTVRVKRGFGKNKKKALALADKEPQIEGNKIIDKQTVPSNNGIILIDNGDNATQKKKSKKKRVVTEVTSTKRKHKEMESPEDSKKKKLKLTANERPNIINESDNSILALGTPSQNCIVNPKTNAPVVASERNKEVVCIGQNTSRENQGGENGKHLHGAIQGNGTYVSMPSHLMPCQTHSLPHGSGLTNGEENTCMTNEIITRNYPWKPGSNYGLDAPNPGNIYKSWSQSDGQNERNSEPRIVNCVSTDGVEESDEDEDDIDFESLNLLTCLPKEGDIIAYRLVETSSGRPELSYFRVGKVIKFNPITMLILLGPVPKYPIFPDGEISESKKSMYKEDGTLEIDFGSLVDLRLVEESKSGKDYSKYNANTWESGTGSHSGGYNDNMNSAWKAPDAKEKQLVFSRGGAAYQGRERRGSQFQPHRGFSKGRNCRGAGGIRKNVNSAWQAGEASNAKKATEYGCGSWASNNCRGGASNPRMGHGNRFGSHDSFYRMNDRAGNNNNNSAWEANGEATNENGATQTQENGWDTWAPNTSRAGASWLHMGQNGSVLGPRGGFSRRGRNSRGGYSNPKFSN